MPEPATDREWIVSMRPLSGDQPVERRVTAAYPTTDEDKPGWTLLKNAAHKVVYQVRDDLAIDIQRADSTGASQ